LYDPTLIDDGQRFSRWALLLALAGDRVASPPNCEQSVKPCCQSARTDRPTPPCWNGTGLPRAFMRSKAPY